MVDISKVSQSVLSKLKNIEMQDGKKGISSNSERNALADMLASGEVTGTNNLEYIQNQIDNYDLKQAEANASKDVKDVIKKAVKLDGDENSLTEREAAVLDQIIDNTTGKYSEEDVQLAKMTKKTMGLTTSTPLSEAKAETEQVKEKNVQLQKEKENLQEVIAQYQQKVTELCNQLNELREALEAKEKELQDANSEVKAELAKHKKAIQAVSDVLLRRISREKGELLELPKNHAEETQNAENVLAKAGAFLGKVGGSVIFKGITNGAVSVGKQAY